MSLDENTKESLGCGGLVALAALGIMTCYRYDVKHERDFYAGLKREYVQTYVEPAQDLEAKIVDVVMYSKSKSEGKYSSVSVQEPQFVFESENKRFVAEFPIREYVPKEVVSLLHAKVTHKEDTPIKLHGTTINGTFYIVSISFDGNQYDTPYMVGRTK